MFSVQHSGSPNVGAIDRCIQSHYSPVMAWCCLTVTCCLICGNLNFLSTWHLPRLLKSHPLHSILVTFSVTKLLTGTNNFIFHEKLSSRKLNWTHQKYPIAAGTQSEAECFCVSHLCCISHIGCGRLLLYACKHMVSPAQEWTMGCIPCFSQCIAWERCSRAEPQVLSAAFILTVLFHHSPPSPFSIAHQSFKALQ